MIFVTVGEQLPFDRLVRAVDNWAAVSDQEIFAQIGDSRLNPVNIKCVNRLAPNQFRAMMIRADLIVAHAGMGTIISALELGKPLIVLPRKAALGEHRNDHQLATSKRFAILDNILVACDEKDLIGKLKEQQCRKKNPSFIDSSTTSPILIKSIREFITSSNYR